MKIKISIFLFSLLLVSFVVGSIISISMKKSLSCIVFQFDDGKKRGFDIDKELGLIFKNYKLIKISKNEKLVHFESIKQIVLWNSDEPYSLSVCAKIEDLSDWKNMLNEIQILLLENEKNLRIYLHKEEKYKNCNKKIQEGYLPVPTDFDEISNIFEC